MARSKLNPSRIYPRLWGEMRLDKETTKKEEVIRTLIKDIKTKVLDVMGQGIKIHEDVLSSEE